MNRGERDPEPELATDLAAELGAAEPPVRLARSFAAATLIGLGQATLVVLDSVAGLLDVLHGLLDGPIDVLANAVLLLLALDTAATGFRFGCIQAGADPSPSPRVTTKRHIQQRWLS